MAGESAQAGWYDDPVGDFRQRWWTGLAWSDHVRTGNFAAVSELTASQEIPSTEQLVWSDARHRLTTHAAYVSEGRGPIRIPWWTVADVGVHVGMGQSLAGTGSVVLFVRYEGYTDRAEWRMAGVADVDRVAAICFTWSRRHRRAAGF